MFPYSIVKGFPNKIDLKVRYYIEYFLLETTIVRYFEIHHNEFKIVNRKSSDKVKQHQSMFGEQGGVVSAFEKSVSNFF